MRKITEATRQSLFQDPIAYEALLAGLLNSRAFAKQILKTVSNWCMKPVQLNTVVTVLSRLRKTLLEEQRSKRLPPLVPDFSISSLTLKTGLTEIAFDHNENGDKITRWLEAQPKKKDDMVITIRGNHELAIIAPTAVVHHLQKAFPRIRPKGVAPGLAAVTVTYPSEEYLFMPGITYALIRQLALHHINMVEKCSTYSEETFFVAEEDAAAAFECLKPFLVQNKNSHSV